MRDPEAEPEAGALVPGLAEPASSGRDRSAPGGGGGDLPALRRLLDTPETTWLVERVRDRVMRARREGASGVGAGSISTDALELSGIISLRDPSAEQRRAVTALIGKPKRQSGALRVDLAVVERVLRQGPWPSGLIDAVETLRGPIIDPRIEREREAAEWGLVAHGLDACAEQLPGLTEWWEAWCTGGGLKRSTAAEARRLSVETSPALGEKLVRELAAVLTELPAAGEPLAVFAGRVLGDAHGLDRDRPLGRLAVAAVQAVFLAGDRTAATGIDADRASARDAWSAVGVVMSSVASTVLCLGAPGAEGGSGLARATSTVLEAMRAARAPVVLTLDQVRSRGAAVLPQEGVVHVCENPTIVEVVAERWSQMEAEHSAGGTREAGVLPVLVCVSGQPSRAAIELIQLLTSGGAECRYHGDFDWAGLRIATVLGEQVPWTPWRYRADDYLEAVKSVSSALRLRGVAAESGWDPWLAQEMSEHALAFEEETVAEQLARDVLGVSE